MAAETTFYFRDSNTVVRAYRVCDELSALSLGDQKTAPQPRPMNGILVAMMVMNCTFASSGSSAI